MMVFVYDKQQSDIGESLNDILSCVKDVFSDPLGDSDFLGISPLIVQGRKEREPVFQSDLIIFLAVAGCGVHAAGTGIERYVFPEQDDRITIQERMATK